MAKNNILKTYGAKDLSVGDVLTTKGGGKYIVVIADMVNDNTPKWGVISGDGEGQIPGLSNEFSFDEADNMVIKGRIRDNGVVIRVERFDCESSTNRLSEALKMLTARGYKYQKHTVWSCGKTEVEKQVEKIVKNVQDGGYSVKELIDLLRKFE